MLKRKAGGVIPDWLGGCKFTSGKARSGQCHWWLALPAGGAVLGHHASLAVANARLVQRLKAAEEKLKKENAFLKTREESRRLGKGEQEIIGQSSAMRALFDQLGKVVDTRVSVLIEGETGVGKELIAAAVHYRSRRRAQLFVTQNCAAMPAVDRVTNPLSSGSIGRRRR